MKNKQLFNVLCVALGAIILMVYFIVDFDNVFLQITGLILLMLGAYRASAYWANHKDDHLEEE